MWDRFIQLSCLICLAISTWAFVSTVRQSQIQNVESDIEVNVDTSKCRPATEEEIKKLIGPRRLPEVSEDKVA